MDNEQNTQVPASMPAPQVPEQAPRPATEPVPVVTPPKKRNWKYTILGAVILIGAFFLIAYEDVMDGFKEWQADSHIKAQINECVQDTGETEVACAMEVATEIYRTDKKGAYAICQKYMGNGNMTPLVKAACDVSFNKEALGIQ